MHILLTDVLACPRCGPEFGLILLADRIDARRVVEGRLGCPNCREQYVISDGVAYMDAGVEDSTADSPVPVEQSEATRIAALLGVTQGPGYVLLAGDAARQASAVADLIADVEVIAVVRSAEGAPQGHGRSLVVSRGIPVVPAKMAGVALTGHRIAELLENCARALKPAGRLLLDPAPDDAAQRLAPLGLRVLAHEGTVLLAVRERLI